jgi:microcystin-dependent protein
MDYAQPIGTAPGTSYVDADPGSGIEGSRVPAAAIEPVMREIVAAIVAAGLTPNGAVFTQLASAIAGATNFPPGALIQFAGPAAPAGWVLCTGQAISRTTFAALFTAIGTNFGVGDGATTFNVPDLRGRTPIGVGLGAGLTNRALAASGGEEAHVLTVAELPAHHHAVHTLDEAQGGSTVGVDQAVATTVTDQNTSDTGSGNAHNIMPPFLALNMIIKT